MYLKHMSHMRSRKYSLIITPHHHVKHSIPCSRPLRIRPRHRPACRKSLRRGTLPTYHPALSRSAAPRGGCENREVCRARNSICGHRAVRSLTAAVGPCGARLHRAEATRARNPARSCMLQRSTGGGDTVAGHSSGRHGHGLQGWSTSQEAVDPAITDNLQITNTALLAVAQWAIPRFQQAPEAKPLGQSRPTLLVTGAFCTASRSLRCSLCPLSKQLSITLSHRCTRRTASREYISPWCLWGVCCY